MALLHKQPFREAGVHSTPARTLPSANDAVIRLVQQQDWNKDLELSLAQSIAKFSPDERSRLVRDILRSNLDNDKIVRLLWTIVPSDTLQLCQLKEREITL